MGAVLSQIQDWEEKVIRTAYASKTFNKAQQNYCTTKRELLAVVILPIFDRQEICLEKRSCPLNTLVEKL